MSEGCFEGPCKEATIGNTLPLKRIAAKQGTDIMVFFGEGGLGRAGYGPRTGMGFSMAF